MPCGGLLCASVSAPEGPSSVAVEGLHQVARRSIVSGGDEHLPQVEASKEAAVVRSTSLSSASTGRLPAESVLMTSTRRKGSPRLTWTTTILAAREQGAALSLVRRS